MALKETTEAELEALTAAVNAAADKVIAVVTTIPDFPYAPRYSEPFEYVDEYADVCTLAGTIECPGRGWIALGQSAVIHRLWTQRALSHAACAQVFLRAQAGLHKLAG